VNTRRNPYNERSLLSLQTILILPDEGTTKDARPVGNIEGQNKLDILR
jgi:hypothetical protein